MKPWKFSDGTVLRVAGKNIVVEGELPFAKSLAILLAMDSQACVYIGPGGSEQWTGADYQIDSAARNHARVRGVEVLEAPDVTYPDPPLVDPDDGPDTIY